MTIKENARAKINLALHVTGQRGDGYHLLDTLVTFADVADVLTFAPAHTLSLTVSGSEAAGLQDNDPQNLILKAANLLKAHMGQPDLGAAITLEKNLPLASGIGGGSADAAAALKGLMRLWDMQIGREARGELALTLGADVPMCLHGTSLRASGVGEDIEDMAMPVFPFVLVNPRIEVSTPVVFSNLASKQNSALPEFTKSGSFVDYLSDCRNDLEQPAIQFAPVISTCINTLKNLPGCNFARMSGSGATCFGIFDSAESATKGAVLIQEAYCDWWVKSSQTCG